MLALVSTEKVEIPAEGRLKLSVLETGGQQIGGGPLLDCGSRSRTRQGTRESLTVAFPCSDADCLADGDQP